METVAHPETFHRKGDLLLLMTMQLHKKQDISKLPKTGHFYFALTMPKKVLDKPGNMW
jgi:hypothetical protein